MTPPLWTQLKTPIVLLERTTWTVTAFNQAACDAIGESLEIGKSLKELFPNCNEARLRKRIERGRRAAIQTTSSTATQTSHYEFTLNLCETALLLEGADRSATIESEAMIASYSKLIESKNAQLEKETRRAEKLLLNVLPRKTIQQLREFGYTTPERFSDVSVLFLDFVGFTRKAKEMTTTELFKELNEIFTAFDEIVEHFQCERIKTIGDAYLAVCGMPNPDDAHAKKIVSVAIEMTRYLEERNQNRGNSWTCRIGIHSAAVIGGVVGRKKYIYDIFGDGVNRASRMESLSEPMRINISQDTLDKLHTEFIVEPRGSVNAKGIGSLPMYFVNNFSLPEKQDPAPMKQWGVDSPLPLHETLER